MIRIKYKNGISDTNLAVLWVAEDFVSIIDLKYSMNSICLEEMSALKLLPYGTSPLMQISALEKRLEVSGQDEFLRLSSYKPCELQSGL
jgi:hypothetical protein